MMWLRCTLHSINDLSNLTNKTTCQDSSNCWGCPEVCGQGWFVRCGQGKGVLQKRTSSLFAAKNLECLRLCWNYDS